MENDNEEQEDEIEVERIDWFGSPSEIFTW